MDDGDLLYPEVQPSIAARHQNLRNPHRPGPIPIRRRSVSTSPARGRVRQRNTYPGTMPYRRQQSHSDEDREAVRRARDIGVRSSSSEPPLPNKRGTLHLMTERKQAAERIIAIDKERARDQENVPSDSAALGTSQVDATSDPHALSVDTKQPEPPNLVADDDIKSALPQQSSALHTEDFQPRKDEKTVKLPVQYQKPSVVNIFSVA